MVAAESIACIESSVVSVVERRRKALTAAEQQIIERTPGFWELAEAGYVSYRRSGAKRFEIEGHRYVGRADLGTLELHVREKVQGTLAGLIDAAIGVRPRLWKADSGAAGADAASHPLVEEFLTVAETHIVHRRPRYEYRDTAGPVLSGALDIARTMRLQATGRFNWFAYREGRLVHRDPLDRLVLFALIALEGLAGSLGVNNGEIYRIRRLANAFADARDAFFSNMATDQMLAVADDIVADPNEEDRRRDLAKLSAVVLLHRGFNLGSADDDGHVPRAWFLDLETLFERAVCNVLRDIVPAWIKVDRGQSHERRLFVNGSDQSRTYPDIVIHRGWDVVAVGDVKYKQGNSPLAEGGERAVLKAAASRSTDRKRESRADIYQLLVHAASVGANMAFLVYPADEDRRCRYLGLSSTGCHTWTLEVRPQMLRDDLASLLDGHMLGLTAPVAAHVSEPF